MPEMTNRLSIRVTEDLITKVNEIIGVTADKYYNSSHVVRCAIIKLHREEIGQNGKNTAKYKD